MHRITAKFYPVRLPDARKPYILYTKYQPCLDIHEIASKAALYNIPTQPEVIEEGAMIFFALANYLVADGYRIKTPLFSLKISIPGVYDGTETQLPDDVHPRGNITLSREFQEYLNKNVLVHIDGVADDNGMIAKIINRADAEAENTISPSSLFEVHGVALKIMSDPAHAGDAGIFLEPAAGGERIRINIKNVTINQPRRIMAIAPGTESIHPGDSYYVIVCTQEAYKGHGYLGKTVREMKSDFPVTVIPTDGASSLLAP